MGGSPAWKHPKIERDRDQSCRSQAAPPGRTGAFCRPDAVAPHRCKKEQGSGKEAIRFDVTYAPPSKDTRCCPSQLNKTRPGECRVCCGFRALEMDAGRVWKPLNDNSQWVRREAAGGRDKEVLLQAQ